MGLFKYLKIGRNLIFVAIFHKVGIYFYQKKRVTFQGHRQDTNELLLLIMMNFPSGSLRRLLLEQKDIVSMSDGPAVSALVWI